MADLNANKVNDMLEALNEAMEIHAQNAIKNLPFNKTELAEVVDITRRDEGWYIVWNGSTRYMAFSENTSYKMGAKVYVNIPNNDFGSQKTIIGQQIGEKEQSIFFRSPLEGYQPKTDNLLAMDGSGVQNEYGLVANWSGEDLNYGSQIIQIFGTDKLLENASYSGYKYIAISANVKTLLGATTIFGDYGIRIMLEGIKKQDTVENAQLETRTYYLDSKNMIGRIYNFETYYKQEALFDISDFDQLSAIVVVVYQNGNFKDNEQNPIPHTYTMNDMEMVRNPNIFLKDIEITFGDDAQSGRDSLMLKTLNGKTYNSSQKESLNRKNLFIDWTHLNPDTEEREKIENTSAARKMTDINNFVIHWYQDSLQSTSDYTYTIEQLNREVEDNNKLDIYAQWCKAENPEEDDPILTEEEKQKIRNILIATFDLTGGVDYDIETYVITPRGEQKIIGATSGTKTTKTTDNLAGPFWREIEASSVAWEYKDFLPDLKRQYTKVKVIIEYWSGSESTPNSTNEGYTRIESNEIQFNNLADILMEDKNSGLRIEFTDKTGGDYPIYNSTTGQLLSRLEETKDREFRAVFNDKNGNSYFNGNEILIWKIPISNSMILMNESFYGSMEVMLPNNEIFTKYENTISYESGYIYIKREAINNTGGPVNTYQKYRIAPYYNKGRTTNTIWCYVIKNNEIYHTAATLTFNQHGTCGTDYTFTLGLGPKIIDETPPKENPQDDDPPQVWTVVGPSDTALTIGDTYNDQPTYHEILFDLYNSKNEKIDLTMQQKTGIINSWVNKLDAGYYSGKTNADNLEFISGYGENQGRVIVRAKDTDINNLKYIVLQAFVSNEVEDDDLGVIEFYQYLPLHIREKNSDWELNGSDYIVYDDKGANPTCYNDKFELISKTPGVNKITNGFEIVYDDPYGPLDYSPKTYYPHIDKTGKLQPTPLYIGSISKNVALIGIKAFGDDLRIVYTCPIVIIENKYQIPAVNKWNGELQIDTQGNKILASMVGAGHKDNNNTFSGVLMGDVEYENAYTGEIEPATGLFGYDKSEQTFGFNTNGQAFIGKSDVGRIYVDGNTGRITSHARESYDINKATNVADDDPRGVDINLRDDYIDIQGESVLLGEDNNKSRVHIDAYLTPSVREITDLGQEEANARHTGAYFSVDNNNGNRLIHIGNESYYLQTDNYSTSNKTGLKLDLKNGELNSFDKITINGGLGSSINFGDSNNYVRLGNDATKGSYLELNKTVRDSSSILPELNSNWNDLVTNFGLAGVASIPRNSNYSLTDTTIQQLRSTISASESNLATQQQTLSNLNAEVVGLQQIERAKFQDKEAAETRYNIAATTRDIRQTELDTFPTAQELAAQIAAAETTYNTLNNTNEVAALEADMSAKQIAADEAYGAWQEGRIAVSNAAANTTYYRSLYDTAIADYEAKLDIYNNLLNDPTASQEDIEAAELAKNEAESAKNTAEINWQNAVAEEQSVNARYSQSVLDGLEDDYNDKNESFITARNAYNDRINQINTAFNEWKRLEDLRDNTTVIKGRLIAEINDLNKQLSAQTEEEINEDGKNLYTSREEARAAYNQALSNLESKTDEYNDQLDVINSLSYVPLLQTSLDNYLLTANEYQASLDGAGSGSIKISNTENNRINVSNKFIVKEDGSVTATKGNIGGWTISTAGLTSGNTRLYSQNQSNNTSINGHSANNWRININNAFGVDADGAVYASKGKIGDAEITDDGQLKVTGLWINGSRYTPEEITVVTSISLSGSAANTDIEYTYTYPPSCTDKRVLKAVSPGQSGINVGGQSSKVELTYAYETVSYTVPGDTVTRTARIYRITGVSLSYTTRTMYVLSPGAAKTGGASYHI